MSEGKSRTAGKRETYREKERDKGKKCKCGRERKRGISEQYKGRKGWLRT